MEMRHIPKNRKERYCWKCGGTMVKSGTNYGRQCWRCRTCDCRTTYPLTKPPKPSELKGAIQERN